MEELAGRRREALDSHLQLASQGSCLPDDLLQLLYVKQLSPSDAASSKQIKLPKNEVKAFLGDLRHKQRCMVVGRPILFHTGLCSCSRASKHGSSCLFDVIACLPAGKGLCWPHDSSVRSWG